MSADRSIADKKDQLIVDPSAQEPVKHGRRLLIPLDEEEVRALVWWHNTGVSRRFEPGQSDRIAQLQHLLSTAAAKEEQP